MPTPVEQRIYHATLKVNRSGIPVIDGGKVLVETTGPWQTWIGQQDEPVPSTKFSVGDRVLVPQDMAEHLERGNAAVIVKKSKGRKKGASPENKAVRASEDKAGDNDELLEE